MEDLKNKSEESEAITVLIKEKHHLFLRELDGLSLWQAKHVLECVMEDLESKSIISSIEKGSSL